MTTYVTFGSEHRHEINGLILDKDRVATFASNTSSEGRMKAFEYFDTKFCMEYFNDEYRPDIAKYFPRGLIKVDGYERKESKTNS